MGITLKDTIYTQEDIDRYYAEGYWTGETMIDILDKHVKNYPDKIALVDKKERVTFKELDAITTRIAIGFLELGIQKGDVISIQLPNWNEFVYAHLAADKIAAVTNPIIPYYRQKELIYELSLTDSVALIIPSFFRKFDYTSMIPDILPQTPGLKNIFVVGEPVPEGMLSFQEFMEKPWEEKYPEDYIKQFRPKGTDVFLMLFSSGTTAEPKGIIHINDNVMYDLKMITRHLGLSSVDVVFVPSPIAHGTGFQWGFRQALFLGAKCVLMETWDPEGACKLIEEEDCSYIFAATPFAVDLVKLKNLPKYNLKTFRLFACAGAPIPSELAKQMEAKMGCKLLPCYGESEHFASTACFACDPFEKIVGSDGYPIPGQELEIFDDNRNILPVGEIGEIAVRGPGVSGGYYKRPKETRETFTESGWQFSGDLAVKDKDGYIRIVGRKKDIIIRGGFNISPSEVEDLLFTHPKIQNVTIVGMPDERLGERGCAYVIPKEGETVTLEEIAAFLKEKKLAIQKLPERLEIVKEFPMTLSGKVQKYLLREEIAKKLEEEKR